MKPGSFVVLALSAGASASKICCSQLSRVLPSRVSFPGQDSYNLTEKSYFSLQEAEIQPACILHPSTSGDVAKAVSVIVSVDGCNFAVKGQGHTPAAGFANIANGVTIDMTTLNSVELNADKTIAKVGAGSTWLNVYQQLDSTGVSVAGGRNGGVGVGGLLLGGGISHFSPRVGWACDSVVNFEVAIANGSLINANSQSHPDLYEALKGGGSNFGVVTRFDLSTFPQGNISAANVGNDISHREAVFKAFTDITADPNFDIYTSLVTGFLFNATSKVWSIGNGAVYTKPVLNPPVFSQLKDIPNTVNTTSITSLAKFANEGSLPPLNWVFATSTFKPSVQLMMGIFDILNTTLYSFNPKGGVVWNIAFEPLAAALLSNSVRQGKNVLGVGPSDNGFVVLFSAFWPEDASREEIYRVARRVVYLTEEFARSKGLLLPFQYLNYAAPHQTPFNSYGEANLKFLKGVAKKYDHQSVFQQRQPGGFKL